MESTSYVFSFRMTFFYLVPTHQECVDLLLQQYIAHVGYALLWEEFHTLDGIPALIAVCVCVCVFFFTSTNRVSTIPSDTVYYAV